MKSYFKIDILKTNEIKFCVAILPQWNKWMVHVYYEIKEIIKNGRKNLLMTTIKVSSVSKKICYDIKTGSSDRQTYLSASGWINQARKSPQIQVIFLRQGLRLVWYFPVFKLCKRQLFFTDEQPQTSSAAFNVSKCVFICACTQTICIKIDFKHICQNGTLSDPKIFSHLLKNA